MGVTLYRPGHTHTVNGVDCELKVFNENSFTDSLAAGWFISPKLCYEQPAENDISDDEIRSMAKELGIKSWHVKKIEKLKTEIESWQQEI